MTREEQVLLYVMAQPDSGYHLTRRGQKDYAALVATGFRPTDAEIEGATTYLNQDVDAQPTRDHS